MTAQRSGALLAVLGCLLAGLSAVGGWALRHWQHDVVVWCMLAMAPLYAGAAYLVYRCDVAGAPARHRRLFLIIGIAAVSRLALLAAPPVSTDIYRYIWDGRVQAAGLNPYQYRPADPALGALRDQEIFPRINRADTAVTIYPPAAQAIFRLVNVFGASVFAVKATMLLFDLLTGALLLMLLKRRRLPLDRLIFYAWHPLPLFEFAGSGHVDAAAIALMLGACLLTDRRSRFASGLLLGAATLVKFFPAVIAPVLYRRWDWRLPVGMAVALMIFYAPYLEVGRQVLGFLPGYAQEEGLVHGTGFFLLGAINAVAPLPTWSVTVYLLLACAVLGVLAIAALRQQDRSAASLDKALPLLGLFLVILSPHFAWYFTWLVPFLCFSPSLAFIYLSGAAPLLYEIVWQPGLLAIQAVLYVPFMVILLLERRSRYQPLSEPLHG